MAFEKPLNGPNEILAAHQERMQAHERLNEILNEDPETAQDEVQTPRRQHDDVEVITIIGRGLVSNFYLENDQLKSSEQKPYEDSAILQNSYDALHKKRSTAVERAFSESA